MSLKNEISRYIFLIGLAWISGLEKVSAGKGDLHAITEK